MLKPAPDVLTRMLLPLRQPRVRAATYIVRQCVCICHTRVQRSRGRT